jgi:hypothetical protein
MNPTKKQIEEFISKAKLPDAQNAITEFSIEGFTNDPLKYMTRFLLEMKDQIDRWDLVMQYLFIHPHVEKMFLSYLGDKVDYHMIEDGKRVPSIWGCYIIANEYISEDIFIGFSKRHWATEEFEDDGRNIALGKLDIKMLNKVNQMKAFW